MPVLGEVRKGTEIGYVEDCTRRYIWAACVDCGKERWVWLRKGLPTNPRCRSCARKGELNGYWKGGRTKAAGYNLIRMPDHPRARQTGYVREHILVWELFNGKSLPEGWVIHHLNGITDDNRPENLGALPNKRHEGILAAKAKRIQELEALLRNQSQLL